MNQENANVSMGDLATVIRIIDLASRRGAFEGSELAGVGMLRNKIEMFLNQNSAKPQVEPEAEAPVEE